MQQEKQKQGAGQGSYQPPVNGASDAKDVVITVADQNGNNEGGQGNTFLTFTPKTSSSHGTGSKAATPKTTFQVHTPKINQLGSSTQKFNSVVMTIVDNSDRPTSTKHKLTKLGILGIFAFVAYSSAEVYLTNAKDGVTLLPLQEYLADFHAGVAPYCSLWVNCLLNFKLFNDLLNTIVNTYHYNKLLKEEGLPTTTQKDKVVVPIALVWSAISASVFMYLDSNGPFSKFLTFFGFAIFNVLGSKEDIDDTYSLVQSLCKCCRSSKCCSNKYEPLPDGQDEDEKQKISGINSNYQTVMANKAKWVIANRHIAEEDGFNFRTFLTDNKVHPELEFQENSHKPKLNQDCPKLNLPTDDKFQYGNKWDQGWTRWLMVKLIQAGGLYVSGTTLIGYFLNTKSKVTPGSEGYNWLPPVGIFSPFFSMVARGSNARYEALFGSVEYVFNQCFKFRLEPPLAKPAPCLSGPVELSLEILRFLLKAGAVLASVESACTSLSTSRDQIADLFGYDRAAYVLPAAIRIPALMGIVLFNSSGGMNLVDVVMNYIISKVCYTKREQIVVKQAENVLSFLNGHTKHLNPPAEMCASCCPAAASAA